MKREQKWSVCDPQSEYPVKTNAARLGTAIPAAEVTVLADVGHYTFLALCTVDGLEAIAPACTEKEGVERAAVHRQVGDLAREFFGRTLAPVAG